MTIERRTNRSLEGWLGSVLATILCLSASPASADLSNLVNSLTKNAGQIWQQRDALLGNIDENQERELGRAAVAVLLGAAPLVEDGALHLAEFDVANAASL